MNKDKNYIKLFESNDFFDQIHFLKSMSLKDYNEYDFKANNSYNIELVFEKLDEYRKFSKIQKEVESPSGQIESYQFFYSDGLCIRFDIANEDIDEDDVYVYDDNDHDYIDELNEKSTNQSICNVTLYYNVDLYEIKNEIIGIFNSCIVEDTKSYFYTIGVTRYGYKLEKHETVHHDIDISLNYGSKFPEKYEELLNRLETSHDGLYLLWGEPGTGKCVVGNTFVTLKNKQTGVIEEVSIIDFYNSFPDPE